MSPRPYRTKSFHDRLDDEHKAVGGLTRFLQIYDAAIPFEAKMRLIVDEFHVSYRTGMRWYYKEKDLRNDNMPT